MLINAKTLFCSMVETLAKRVSIELQTEGWAVIIDGETVTWSSTEDKAVDVAIKLIDAGY